MKLITLYLLFLTTFQELPFKAKEEFEIKLDYQFKQRPQADRATVYLDETQGDRDRRTSTDILPYLVLKVKLLKLSEEEVRVRIHTNLDERIGNKKIEIGSILPIDLGFTADVKDRTSAHEYILTFLSPKKSETSKVVIFVEEDGSFFVNGEKRGKF